MPSDADLNKAQSQLRSVARQGLDLADELERGLAQTPIRDRFELIGNPLPGEPFPLALVGLTQEARSAALAWLCGADDIRVLSVSVPNPVGLVEIRLQERGYVLEQSNGHRREFDRLDAFLEAIREADLVHAGDAESWIDPLKIGIAAPPGMEGLHILMPDNPRTVLERPALLRELVSATNVCCVAGLSDYEPTPEDREAIAELSSGLPALWPVVIPSKEEEFPARGWWTDRGLGDFSTRLPEMRVGEEGSDATMLSDPRSPIRRALSMIQRADRLRATAELVSEQHRQEAQLSQTRQRELSRQLAAIEAEKLDPGEARRQAEQVRQWVQDEVSRISNETADRGRRALLPNGPVATSVKEVVERISPADFHEEQTSTSIRLSLQTDALSMVNQMARRAVQVQLHEDVGFVRDQLTTLLEQLGERIVELRGSRVPLDVPLPDERELRQGMADLFNIEIRYKGEIPRRGLGQRLMEGRRPLMYVMMGAGLLGPLLGLGSMRQNPGLAVFFLLVFAAGVGYTFVGWKDQDRDRIEKELEKVQESVATEAKRAVSEVHREKLARLQSQLNGLTRDLSRRVDVAAQEGGAGRQEQVEADRANLKNRIRAAEQRSRESQQRGQRISKLGQSALEVDRLAQKALYDALADARSAQS